MKSSQPSAVSFQLVNERRKHAFYFDHFARKPLIIPPLQYLEVVRQQIQVRWLIRWQYEGNVETRHPPFRHVPSAMFASIEADALRI
jgi:hypothetical protein